MTALTSRTLALLALALAAPPALAAPRADAAFETVRVPGSPVTIGYPAGHYARQGGEGPARFLSRDGKSEFTLESRPNTAGWTAQDLAKAAGEHVAAKGARGLYRRVGGDWLVLSGLHKGKVFYYKVVLSEGRTRVNTFQVDYPHLERNAYGPVVARMSRSFQPVP